MLSGNTTMLSIFHGINPEPIGKYPYIAPVLDFCNTSAVSLGFAEFPNASVIALPAKAAFLGADLVAGLSMCREEGFTQKTFFIDLGTNGELFVSNSAASITAASCAMGPALEGMSMSCGMTADDGAITHIRESSGKLEFDKIGNGEPAGLTGTAIIELAALLLEKRAISKTGAMTKAILPSPAQYIEDDGIKEIKLFKNISITQKDIRNLQLAKAASLSASRLLLDKSGLEENDIRHVVIAGAIGEHLDITAFKRLGFIPEFKNAGWKYLGNTSLKAAEKACLDTGFFKRTLQLRDEIREIELANEPSFQDVFLKAIDFP
jgi:uncharacterized 2Fe-2S/4Fe-4S cluster protein (DUF4445 family)